MPFAYTLTREADLTELGHTLAPDDNTALAQLSKEANLSLTICNNPSGLHLRKTENGQFIYRFICSKVDCATRGYCIAP